MIANISSKKHNNMQSIFDILQFYIIFVAN